MPLLWLIGAILLLVGVQGAVFKRYATRKIRYQRFFDKKTVTVGEKVLMVESLENHKLMPIPLLAVESRMSPHLRFRSTLHATLSDDDFYHRSLFFLAPYNKIVRRYELTCTHRGVYDVGTVALTGSDLFGLGRRTQLMDMGERLVVYPTILHPDQVPTPCTRLLGDVVVRRWIVDDPFLVGGIRDYQPGDPQKDVHWRATAHTGRLQIKVHDRTADPRMMVLLNLQPREHIWVHVPKGMLHEVEYAISLCASMCLQALEAGVEAGFACNGTDFAAHNQPLIQLPARSMPQMDALLELMARIVVKVEHSISTFVDRYFVDLPPMDIVLVSGYEDEVTQQALRILRQRGHRAQMLVFSPPERGSA